MGRLDAFGDVLINFLTNAGKSSPAGRRIIVSATPATAGPVPKIGDAHHEVTS